MRRTVTVLEESLDQGLQWVAFEPNEEALWVRARLCVVEFLTACWRLGALCGELPSEAYFVRCDRSTMTQDDLDNGRLVVLIGVAAVRPAEFVVLRVGQWTADASR